MTTESPHNSPQTSSLRDLLLVTRAPLAMTAIADAFVAFLIARGPSTSCVWKSGVFASIDGLWTLSLLVIASASAYLGGMALNDYCDRERDQRLAPTRPIPAGRLDAGRVRNGALILLELSVAAAFFLSPTAAAWAVALVAAVVGYDAVLKAYRVPGCVAMASCRAFNILMAHAAGLAFFGTSGETTAYFGPVYAGCSFLYIFALTLLSTYEDDEAPKPMLALSAVLLLAPALILVFQLKATAGWSFSLALLGLFALVLWRIYEAWTLGTVMTGQGTTRWLIRGTLLLGALALLLLDEWFGALIVLSLAGPYILGAKWLFSPPKASS